MPDMDMAHEQDSSYQKFVRGIAKKILRIISLYLQAILRQKHIQQMSLMHCILAVCSLEQANKMKMETKYQTFACVTVYHVR